MRLLHSVACVTFSGLFCFILAGPLTGAQKLRLGDLPQESQALSEEDRKKLQKKQLAEEVANEFYEKGLQALRDGKIEQAEGFFDRAIILNPDHEGARKGIEFIMKSYEGAEKRVEEEKKKKQADLINALIQDLSQKIEAGKLDEANDVAEKILAIDPKNKTAGKKIKEIQRKGYLEAVGRAKKHEKAGAYKKAIEAYQDSMAYKKDASARHKIKKLKKKIAERNRKKSEELYLKALAVIQEDKVSEAMDLCKKALALDPENLQAQRMLSRLKSMLPQ